jgi:hypothetical protein
MILPTVFTAFIAVRPTAPGSPQELRENTSAAKAIHWMKRFMRRQHGNPRRRVKRLVQYE